MTLPTSSAVLWAVMRRHKPRLGRALIGVLVHLICLLLVPAVSRFGLNAVVTRAPVEDFLKCGAALVALGLGLAVGGALRKYNAHTLMAAAGTDLRGEVYEHLQRVSFALHDRLGPGQLMSRSSSDILAVENLFGMVPYLTQTMLLAVGSAAALALLDPIVAIAVVTVIVSLSALNLRLARPMDRLARDLQDRIGEYGAFVEQQVGGIRVVKGFGAEDFARADSRRHSENVEFAAVTLARQQARVVAGMFTVPATATIALLGGLAWLSAGRLSAADAFAAVQYLGLLAAPAYVLSHMAHIWPRATGAANRIAEVLGSKVDARPVRAGHTHPTPLRPGPGALAFREVCFGYRDRPVLDKVTLDIEPGTAVALVGASGSGKSSLALLVPRLYEPWSGEVLIDGQPIGDVAPQALRAEVAMVFEDTVVFGGTLRENVALGRLGATDDEIERACRVAHAHEFIAGLPQGYDTWLGENGTNLSGGQRQRIAIARAVLRNPRVLILDDATSAVDVDTEAAIWDGLGEVMAGRTTLIVAHRAETLALADRVVVLDHGRVVADGPPTGAVRKRATREAAIAVGSAPVTP